VRDNRTDSARTARGRMARRVADSHALHRVLPTVRREPLGRARLRLRSVTDHWATRVVGSPGGADPHLHPIV